MAKMRTFNKKLTREKYEVEVTVEYEYYPGCRGAREKYGVPLEPDEPPIVLIDTIYLAGTDKEISVTDDEYDDLERVAWSNHKD